MTHRLLRSVQGQGAAGSIAEWPLLLPDSGVACCALLLIAGALGGCRTESSQPIVEIAPGIAFRRDQKAGIQLLDVDLLEKQVHPMVVAEGVQNREGNYVGDARTVREWAERYHAIGGINGGFFGDTYDQVGRRKQIVQVAVVDGVVVAPGSAETAAGTRARYVRSAIGFLPDGTPDIVWGSGNKKAGPRYRTSPDGAEPSRPWQVESAVACGPRLFAAGARRITEHEEQFNSPQQVARAFVAYDLENGAPRHLVIGRASAMDFRQLADYIADYFPLVHHTTPHEAMCLDGGPSAQIVYRDRTSGDLIDAEPSGVMVPTAILLVPNGATPKP